MIAERTERGRADRRHRPWRPIRSAAGPAASREGGTIMVLEIGAGEGGDNPPWIVSDRAHASPE